MSQRLLAVMAVTVAIIKDNQILLVRRKNTGYMDGYYAVPGGHLEIGETLQEGAIRELKEETGLIADPKDAHLFQVLYETNKNPPYISFRFCVTRWKSKLILGDPEKSDDVGFFDLNKLPKVSPYVRMDIEALGKKEVVIKHIDKNDLEE